MVRARMSKANWRALLAGALVVAAATGCAPGPWGPGGGAGGGGAGGGGAGAGVPFDPAATPELGSLVLFGSGAAGFAGYALTRLRAGRGGARPGGRGPAGGG